MSDTEIEYDCQACGACCAQPEPNWHGGYAEMFRDEAVQKPLKIRLQMITAVSTKGSRTLHATPGCEGSDGFRCTYLRGAIGVKVQCIVYDDRPDVCSTFEPGGAMCLASRAEYGVK